MKGFSSMTIPWHITIKTTYMQNLIYKTIILIALLPGLVPGAVAGMKTSTPRMVNKNAETVVSGLKAGTVSKAMEMPVKVKEDSLLVPTYVVLPPNPMPRFYEGQAHQGVQRRYYPYPMNDNLTRTKVDKRYHIVYLENEYIRIGVMPGLGGRIFEAVDKTNGYNFFYRQHVIKPSLIGMVGYWISGGNAWGFPHHHGPHTVALMDYQVERHADGSTTVWISHIEKMHRLRILLGYTVRPGSSTVEMTIKPYNPTPYTCSFLSGRILRSMWTPPIR